MNWTTIQRREAVAKAGTLLAGLFILFLVKTVVMSQEMARQSDPVNLSLIDTPPEPKKIIEPPVPKVMPARAQPTRVITPVSAAPATATTQVVVPVAVPVAAAEPVHKAEPLARVSNSAAEGAFAQDVRSKIERKKIFPDAARDLGMSGEVEIVYELDRAGNLLNAEIAVSSGFKPLDRAALAAVKTAGYKAFPEDAWLGASSKVFRTKLVFSINQ